MRQIASIKGKLYELKELTPEEVLEISKANNFDNPERFIERHHNWRSTIGERGRVHDSFPLTSQPKNTPPPAKEPKKKSSDHGGKKRKNQNPRRISKYDFKKLAVGDEMFIQDAQSRISASAGYYGRKCKPKRFFSVRRRIVDGVQGVIVKRKV